MKHSESQSFISKNHMRNLRAKVKQLITPDRCKCSYHRQDRVQQLQFKKKIWKSKQSKKLKHWDYPVLLKEPFYNQQKCELQKKPEFEKLSEDEIQQISEFKHYYLGEKNIDAFREFLQDKQLKKQKLSIKLELDNNKRSHKSVREEETLNGKEKHKSHHELSRPLTKYPSNYRRSRHEQYLDHEFQKRAQAKSNYQNLLQKQQRIRKETIDKSDTKLMVANRTKQELINRYVSQLEANDHRHTMERLKIVEKRKKQIENNEIFALASKLKKMCSFKPSLSRKEYSYNYKS